MVKPSILFCLVLFWVSGLPAQELYFPPLIGNSWDTVSPESMGWCTEELEPLYDYLDDQNTKAFILLKDGKIVVEKYFGAFTRDSSWYWASAGKSLTAFLVGLAQEQGYFSIFDTTSEYIGEGWTNCSLEMEEKITIRNQLTMTTGLDDGVEDHYCTLDTCLNYLADAGTRWAYHNGPYTLLDEVVENATQQTINSFLIQNLTVKTGITGAFFKAGYNNIFVSKARSMARYGLLILNEGNWNGNQVMTDSEYFGQMISTSQELNKSYGYLWWLNGKESFMLPTLQYVFAGSLMPDAPDKLYAALGKNGQVINVVPDQNLVLVRMGDSPDAGEVAANFNNTIWQYLNKVICTPSEVVMDEVPGHTELYPNPCNGEFMKINFHDDSKSCKIYNSHGQQVKFRLQNQGNQRK